MSSLYSIFEFLFALGILINASVYIPQALKLIKIKHAREISLLTFSAFNIFLFIQLIYAFVNHDAHLFWGSLLILCSSLFVTLLIVYYRIKTGDIDFLFIKRIALAILSLVTISIVLLQVMPISGRLIHAMINILYGAAFLWTVLSAIPQITKLLRAKDSRELSIITFLGFNFIQIVTIAHAYFYKEWLLLAGVALLLSVYAYLSCLVIYYRVKVMVFNKATEVL